MITPIKVLLSVLVLFTSSLYAGEPAESLNETYVRWTGSEDTNADLDHVLAVLSAKTGQTFTRDDFRLNEDRTLAYSKFQHYPQHHKGFDIEGAVLRIWADRSTGKLIQVEAHLSLPETNEQRTTEFTTSARSQLGFVPKAGVAPLTPTEANRIALAAVRHHPDHQQVRILSTRTVWKGSLLVTVVRLGAARGRHEVWINAITQRVMKTKYVPHATSELEPIEAELYPFYEEFAGTILPREKVRLDHLLPTVRYSSVDPFSPLRDRKYLSLKMEERRGSTPEGRSAGYWSMSWLLNRVSHLAQAVPELPNTFDQGGVRLAGRYSQVMIHPAAIAAYPSLGFTPVFSANPSFDWQMETDHAVGTEPDSELKFLSSYYGKPLSSAAEAMQRPATRHPFHDAGTYLREGFDELQVYYAINTFFAQLHSRGFSDPELSTRPFTAFLFNPDIEMRDNAYYTNDTINFTTYSSTDSNLARDNLTIWHELGHGLMDRLMDDGTSSWLHLADTGGLSEGMADFTADLILYGLKGTQDFPGRTSQRIHNGTGFLLTNEVHDDGEAYGGVMHDILARATEAFGADGVNQMTDLTLEAMRLTRFHPHLTAADFFEHMQFADQLGRPNVRAPGAFSAMIREALASRNFAKDSDKAAAFSVKYNGNEVSAGTPGSRGKDIAVTLPMDGTAHFELDVSLKDGEDFQWTYPVQIKPFKRERGALQGAVHWVGEELPVDTITLTGPNDAAKIPLEVTGICDSFNRPERTCSDYVYLLVFDGKGKTVDAPIAKKRFYVKVTQSE